ncbi:MAG: isochorismate synthase [Ignavibacteriaceae bacterium]|nr:isochorismate synthase [Ignavibacteriaceae bacterium]
MKNYLITEFEYFTSLEKAVTQKNFYFFSSPSNSFEFFACGKTKRFQSIDKTDLKQILESIQVKNFLNLSAVQIPFLIYYQKFPDKIKEPIWSNFETSNILIFEYIYIRTKDNFYKVEFDKELFHLNSENHSTIFCQIDDSLTTPENIYFQMLNRGISYLSSGKLEKIVLCRREVIDFDYCKITKILSKAKSTYQNCNTILIKNGQSAFLTVTPETLIKKTGGEIFTEALAGSIPADVDNQRLNELLRTSKNLKEHTIVRDFILERIQKFVNSVSYNEIPEIKKLRSVYHLQTPIVAKLLDDIDHEELIFQLFPTPALSGFPKETAINLISELENFERGFFGGFSGFITLNGDWDFSVCIRCALIKENKALLYAGGGIMMDSDPELEYYETEAKLLAIKGLIKSEL